MYSNIKISFRASSNATKVNPKQSNYLVPGKSTLYTLPTDSPSKNTQTDVSNQSDNVEFVELDAPVRTNIPNNRYITKKPLSKSTDQVSSTGTSAKPNNLDPVYTLNNSSFSTSPSTSSHKLSAEFTSDETYALIDPTTYSPPRFQIRKTASRHSRPFVRPKTNDFSQNTTPPNRKQASLRPIQFRESTRNAFSNRATESFKFVPKIAPLSPISINQELITNDDTSSEEMPDISTESNRPKPGQKYFFTPKKNSFPLVTTEVEVEERNKNEQLSTTPFINLVSSTDENIPKNQSTLNPDQKILEKLNRYKNSSTINPDFVPQSKVFKSTVEIPPIKSLISDSDPVKEEPDLSPIYKLKPFKLLTKTAPNKTDSSLITSTPRVSRINPAFKFMMNSLRGTKGGNAKCKDSASIQICSDLKLRYFPHVFACFCPLVTSFPINTTYYTASFFTSTIHNVPLRLKLTLET